MAGSSETGKQGTGKHTHKSTEEPVPHTKDEGKQSGSGAKTSATAGGASSGGNKAEDSDLKSREYRDKDGNIHHHTHTAGKQERE